MRRTIFEQLMHEAKYAQNSNSKCLLYEVHGKSNHGKRTRSHNS